MADDATEQRAGHTPGPWRAEEGTGRGAWIMGSTGEWSALACGDTDESARANAQLIAAAPDLYEAALAAKNLLIKDLEEPGRTVFWQLVSALRAAGWVAPDPARAVLRSEGEA